MEGNTHKYVAEEGNRDLFCRRAPHGARGLKRVVYLDREVNPRRAPHGARGLKQKIPCMVMGTAVVAPHTGRVD